MFGRRIDSALDKSREMPQSARQIHIALGILRPFLGSAYFKAPSTNIAQIGSLPTRHWRRCSRVRSSSMFSVTLTDIDLPLRPRDTTEQDVDAGAPFRNLARNELLF